jgi:RND family efflux transporter MFP subunit
MRNLRRVAVIIIIVALVIAAVLFAYKRLAYQRQSNELKQTAGAGPFVNTATVVLGPQGRVLTLIGEAKPYAEVTLYSKVSGYLHAIPVDKGDKVKKGQLIASIESPETDQDFAGASADSANKRAIANRMKALKEKNLISRQEAEQADADARVSESRRDTTGVIKSYETMHAPFDGTITARYADPGSLVQAATGAQTGALPLVRISDVTRLRIFVYLDQKDASYVKIGDPVEIRIDETPGHTLKATISRITNELDPATRMLQTEIDVDNKNNAIIPGSFVHVDLKANLPRSLEVPSEALVYQQKKNQVAVVENNTIHYRDVVVQSNDGRIAQIASGLKEGEIVAIAVGSSLLENSKVQPIAPRK